VGYVANIARMNAATVASLASAPPTPAGARATRQGRATVDTSGAAAGQTNSGGQAWTLSWQPSEGAVSYELVIRRTTSSSWEQVVPLANVTSCMLHRQLDDEWVGVRAVGANGARSMAASMPAPNPPRPAPGQVAAARGSTPGAGAPAVGRGGAGAGGRGPTGPPPQRC